MPRIEENIRWIIIQKLKEGFSQHQVSDMVYVKRSTVQKIWNKFRTTGTVQDLIKTGRPLITNERERRKIILECKKDPFKPATEIAKDVKFSKTPSIWTIRRILKKNDLGSFMAARKPFLNNKQVRRRLLWCKAYGTWSMNQWKKTLFSDECKFELFCSRRKLVRRPLGKRFLNRYVTKTVRQCVTKLMVWGCIGYDNRMLIKCPHRLNSVAYVDILDQAIGNILKPDKTFIQDGAPCHRAKNTINFLEDQKILYMSDWPAQSPDINIIENMWYILKEKVRARHPKTRIELWQYIVEEWQSISSSTVHRLYESIPTRIYQILRNKGYNTKY